VWLQLFALAYNLGNFLRRLALPQIVQHWSLTTLREKLIKIGAKIVCNSRYMTFQVAEVAISRSAVCHHILEFSARVLAISPCGNLRFGKFPFEILLGSCKQRM